MLSQLVQSLVESTNEAADEVLLEALRLGNEAEKALALNALLRRATVRGLVGVIGQYGELPQSAQLVVLKNIRTFHPALREAGRGRDVKTAAMAMKLIALGRQGKLTYILTEGLHSGDDTVAQAAVDAMVALARWISTESRKLQRGQREEETASICRQIVEDRPEVEKAVARALEVHRGQHGQDLLRAAMLLADWPGSRTLAILQTPKHGGQSAMIRRLQQAPDSEHAEAFLLAASHGGVRGQFGVIFAHIDQPPVLDAMLRRTHWLKDQQLRLCIHQITRGVWCEADTLQKDLARREDDDAARIAEWIGVSGLHDVMQDELLEKLRLQLGNSLAGRLRLLRVAMGRPAGASVALLRSLLSDPDERIVRMTAREIVRRHPPDFDNMLVQLMAGAPESVRRVIGRSVGETGFDNYWNRFDRLDKSTRKTAGRAMFKLLPDSLQRLERRLRSGPVEQRLRAAAIAQDLDLAETMRSALVAMCQDVNPRLRSKAVSLLADIKSLPPDAVLDRALNDSDPRVRANAIEVLEAKRRVDFVPVLAQRARSASSRERANAIKAMHRMRVGTASGQLLNMLQDERSDHRISALWALKQIGWWQMLTQVGRMAKEDGNLRVRRYALAVLKNIAESAKNKAG